MNRRRSVWRGRLFLAAAVITFGWLLFSGADAHRLIPAALRLLAHAL